MAIVYIGIGSNLGNRQENCREAVRLLTENSIKVLQQSSLLETEPWGVADQPRFINQTVEAETILSPEELLRGLKNIERTMGRSDAVRWGPRIIDLDILFYDDIVLETAELTIPHPLLHERDFVLRPLAEIAPEKLHPKLKKSVHQLLADLTLRLLP